MVLLVKVSNETLINEIDLLVKEGMTHHEAFEEVKKNHQLDDREVVQMVNAYIESMMDP